ncbi:NFATC2-interacting protein [Scomber japonicus]|uniref:NFATC2-interacting protein n=1 Tax=Scomber japonicus TaxID=13676 RepID=UPI0023050A7F|nr:NFATC2-interacting protein [Scomber japonicus]
MAEAVSDSEKQPAVKPPPKRRRLDPSAVVPVPIYSNKVNNSLHLKPMAPVFTETQNADDGADDNLLSQMFSSRGTAAALNDVLLSDSEDETERVQNKAEDEERRKELEAVRCPSPPPPESPVQKPSRKVTQKISEIDRKLRAVNSLLSPEPRGRRARRRRGPPSASFGEPQDDDDIIIVTPEDNNNVHRHDDDDDIIIINPLSGSQDSPYSSLVREIPLKIRCRTVVHKIPVLSSTPLSDVVSQLSVILKVPPPRLLLLREEVELPTDATVSELGLGIADIIECVTMAAEDKSVAVDDSSSIITVRLQSKDRDATQEFSLHTEESLGSIFSQYLSKMSVGAKKNVSFQFDGAKVTASQTPAQLDMEDGDIIEVWM